jgi:hypothetical protein
MEGEEIRVETVGTSGEGLIPGAAADTYDDPDDEGDAFIGELG